MAFKIHRDIIMTVSLSTSFLKNVVNLENRLFIIGSIIALILFAANVFGLSFLMNHFSTELKSSLFAILQVAGGTSALYSLIIFWIHRKRIPRIAYRIRKVQGAQLSDHVVNIQRIGEKLTKILLFGIVAAFFTILGMAFLSGFYLYYKNGAIDFSRIYRPYIFE